MANKMKLSPKSLEEIFALAILWHSDPNDVIRRLVLPTLTKRRLLQQKLDRLPAKKQRKAGESS